MTTARLGLDEKERGNGFRKHAEACANKTSGMHICKARQVRECHKGCQEQEAGLRALRTATSVGDAKLPLQSSLQAFARERPQQRAKPDRHAFFSQQAAPSAGEVQDSGLRSGVDENNGGLCSASGNGAGRDLGAAAPCASGVTATAVRPQAAVVLAKTVIMSTQTQGAVVQQHAAETQLRCMLYYFILLNSFCKVENDCNHSELT